MSKPDVKINDRGGEWYYCPCCGEQIDKFEEECTYCGEIIDWEEIHDVIK